MRNSHITSSPGTLELEKIIYEFEAYIEAGPTGGVESKVIIYGKPNAELIKKVESRERFCMKLSPNSDGTFLGV